MSKKMIFATTLVVLALIGLNAIIIMQDDIITELEARQPKITEECVNGVLHRAQQFGELKVYDSKFEECVK